MTKVRDVFGLNQTKGDIGVEIEVEGKRLPGNYDPTTKFNKFWFITQDGSLRGEEAFEYVLREPLNLNGVQEALQEVEKSYKKCGSTITDTVRAGVHVHVNCQELSMKQMAVFATVYYVMEELLLMFCNPTRRGNLFCLRAKDAEYQIFNVHNAFLAKSRMMFNDNNIRYSAINFCSLGKFGSLEFRSLEGTEDLGKIFTWAKILKELRDNSKQFDNPVDVVTGMSDQGADTFVANMLGDNMKHFKHIEDIDNLILSGVRYAQDLVFGINWDDVEGGWTGEGNGNGYRLPQQGARQRRQGIGDFVMRNNDFQPAADPRWVVQDEAADFDEQEDEGDLE